MGSDIIVNVAREETRVAVLDRKILTDLYIDRAKQRDFVGNVYKGKVVKVLPGLQAAFIDIGQDKAAFMHVSELIGAPEMGEPLLELDDKTTEVAKAHRHSSKPIEDLLEEGQELMVQVTKGPIGTKGSRVTAYVSLPGRYLVFMPTVEHIGISRRIEKDEERSRLKQLMQKLRKPGSGYIVRTVSEGVSDDELRSDVEFLQASWEEILEKKRRLKAPALLHSDLDLVFRTVRDHFTKDVQHLWIDSKVEYEAIREFVSRYLPEFLSRIHLYMKEEPIFDHFDLESEIARAMARKVWLKSGGHIVIDHTEAMTVIDVNTGRFVGKRDLEETIVKTNLEAVKEIAYQLKLRSIGGIIIIDFIDMERERNREKVFQALNEALGHDKARTKILKVSELGLVEMSRERVREDLYRALSEPCRYCEGRAYTKDPTTICYELFRDIRRLEPTPDESTVVIGAHPSVASVLTDEEAGSIADLERECQVKISIKPDSTLHIEQYDIVML
ncbi:MAG: Rne/Rng family ribonuclease [Nitrospirae bacterium]|nr:MAG: Rne/Rng family ribonuclease [Nitrospirota bacterium]